MDYNNGKIYTIRSPHTDKYYIGSSTQSLSKRFSLHKNDLKYCSSKEIITLGDSYIELLENFPCKSKDQLNAREYQLIREHKNYLVNIFGVKTEEEKYKNEINNKKEYYEKNKDEIIKQKKDFYEKHKDEILLKKKEYCEKNKDKISERDKKYREKNKEKISAYKRERYRLKIQSKELNI